jgi:hypothetical protein
MEAVTRDEIQSIADEAAEKATAKMLVALGIPAGDPLKAQAIFLHLERQYDACQTVKQHSLKTAVGIVTTALVAYVLLAFGIKGIK